MNKKSKRFYSGLPRRVGAFALSAAMIVGDLYAGPLAASAATTSGSWKTDVESALQGVQTAEGAADSYGDAVEALKNAYDSLEGSQTVEGLVITEVGNDYVKLEWNAFQSDSLVGYNVYWADSNTDTTMFQLLDSDSNNSYDETVPTISINDVDASAESITFIVKRSTFKNLWFKVAPLTSVGAGSKTEAVMSPTTLSYNTKLENLDRGMTATAVSNGVFLNWRLLFDEVDGYSETGLTGYDFNVYRNGEKIATVTDSTNYLDSANTTLGYDTYKLVPVKDGAEITDKTVTDYVIFTADSANSNTAYYDIPLQKPADTTFRETYGIDTMALGGYTWTDSGYGTVDDTITYSANDMSVADVDGDGKYEYLLQWEPSYSKDVSQQGYTGKTYIDCYELDGTLRWRLDMGINIRAGAHYTQFGVYDYDADGKAEMIVKTAPGTQMIQYELDANGKNVKEADGSLKVASRKYVTIPAEDAAEGVTDSSNYVFSVEDYRQYLIDVFQDWGVWSRYSAETVANAIEGHWDNNLVNMFSVSDKWRDTKFYTGEVKSGANVTYSVGSMTTEQIQQYIPDYAEGDVLVNVCLYDDNGKVQYVSSSAGSNAVMKTVRVQDVKDYQKGLDLNSANHAGGYSKEEATILADYFLAHYQYRMKKHNLNTYEGYVITGPEYVTLYDCETGTELDSQDWYYGREDDGMLWGDYAMDYIEPGNRCDRFNVAIAYLDGETASCVMGRGYYTRTTMAAYNVVDKKLSVAGAIDSGWTVMTNPFNDSPHGFDGCDPVNAKLSGQGDHYIAVADIDLDGRQDIINGGAIVSYDMDAKDLYLYSSGGDNLKGGQEDQPWAKYGHGDAIHITDIDPDRPGLEIVSCFEGATSAPYNWALRDAISNTVIFGAPGTSDFGRIIIGDVLPEVRGLEVDTGFDCKGNAVSLIGVSNNMNIKWAADMTTQFVAGTTNVTITGNVGGKATTFVSCAGYSTNNGTKGNPGLVADLFGDYREEMILRSSDSSSLRIYMNTEVSTHKNYTLMQNPQYRVGVASQNSAYNQPAYTDYYYASDTDWSRVTVPHTPADQEPGKVIVQPTGVTISKASVTIYTGNTYELTAEVVPVTAEQTVTWSVDDESIATVDESGVVTAVAAGTATVTATTINGKTAAAKIIVKNTYVEAGTDKFAVGDSKTFAFGTNGTVKADTVYSEANGYGWKEHSANITLTDGDDYVAGNNYLETANSITTWEYPTFLVDVPVGIYEVKIVQGTNGTDDAVNGAYVEGYMYAGRWSTESFTTSYSMPTESSWIYTKAGETKETTVETAVADGQLTIDLATSLTDDNKSGTTYIKEITVTRKQQNTKRSEQPTLRFIGDSTLAKYPPEDGQVWTPIPERTGWGEDFSMGKFVDEEVVLVNKAVAGSSLKSYIYDGYYNDFFLNSNPGDTVIIESGINDSAAGRRYSDAAEFEAGLRYLIESCQAFGLDVIISSGTSSGTQYTAKMESLAEEFGIPYVDLLGQWGTYLGKVGSPNLTVDGTHLKRVGGIVAAQIVANSIKDLEGYSISGHVLDIPLNYEKPTVKPTGLYAKAQTESSVTLAWSISEDDLYQYDQLITDFVVYGKKKGSSETAAVVATQTAYVSAGMDGPQLYTTLESPADGTYTYYVTAKSATGEGPASNSVDVAVFAATDAYTLQSLIDQYDTQLYDASVYTTESYAALKVALASAKALLAKADVTDAEITEELAKVNTAIEGLEKNVETLVETTFEDEALKTAPWGVSGNHASLMSAVMDTNGNRMLRLYVEAAGSRTVNKVFEGAGNVNAATQMIEFAWYPGKPDSRNCTEVEFWSSDSTRVLSLKSAKVSDEEGHIGYVVGNYPDNTGYLTGTGFHDYEGSTAVDLGLTSEAWYNVKIVFNYADGTADLYIEPKDDASLEGKTVKNIKINTTSNTITKMNFLLMRGKQDNGTSNDLSILWDTRFDDYGIYYVNEKNTVDTKAYETALTNYQTKVAGLNSAALSDQKFALAEAVIDIMASDVGFHTAADYAYAVSALEAATAAAPALTNTTSVNVSAGVTNVTAGLTTDVTAKLSAGANEEIVWSSSDDSVATVEGNGLSAVVTARKAGNVTITAAGAKSGVKGNVALTVTGTAYFFGKDTVNAYDAETGYGFVDYTYPKEAKGWIEETDAYTNSVKSVYSARELIVTPGEAYIAPSESADDYLAINGQVWTELPDGGRDEDTITYENTNAFAADFENGNYRVTVTFCNPGKTSADVMVKAEDIRRYDYGDHATSQIAETTVNAGQTATAGFDIALTDGQLDLRFEQAAADKTYDAAATRTVYVKSVSVEEIASKSSDKTKTTIYTVGDSTVQTYTKANSRNGWAQLLYTLFGTETAKEETDTGYAYYETEDTIIKNYARDGRSAKSFLEEGRLNEVLLNVNAGDYVFLQFAHNDDNQARPNRYLNIDSYKEYLGAYNAALAERGATLVLVTPIVLNVWEADQTLDHRFDDYRLAMMQLADEEDIPVLDLMGSTLELVSSMGSTNVNALNMYMSDAVHTQPAGAEMFKNLLGNLLLASTDAKLADVQKLMNVTATGNSIAVDCADELKVGDAAADITITAGEAAETVDLYSSDENVAKIVDNQVVAVGGGQAIITAGYVVGDKTATDCTAYTDYKVITVAGEKAVSAETASLKTDMFSAALIQNKDDVESDEAVSGTLLDTLKLKAPEESADDTEKASVSKLDLPISQSAAEVADVKTPEEADTAETETSEETENVEVETMEVAEEAGNVTVYTDAAVAGKMASPLADYQFDFGYKNGNAPAPFKSIVADVYDAEKGYGFISDASGFTGSHVANHRDDNVVANGDSEYDMALYAAVKDGSRQPEWEFAIDLPAGEYMVNVYVGSGTNTVFEGASYYINGVQICDSWTLKGDSYSVDDCGMSARVVLAEDGQIVVKGEKAGSLALISAITVNEYVDKIDAYDADAWATANAEIASLLVKTSMFEKDSTPFDYDAVLVNKMLSTKDALEAVMYMPVADTTDGDAAYALAEEAVENNSLYTEASMEILKAAMTDYVTAKSSLSISESVVDAYETIAFWLQGVDTENLAEAYAGYFDFNNTQTGGSAYNDTLAWEAPGWTSVGSAADHPALDLYSAETGYGMLAAAAGRNRGTGNAVLDDFILGGSFAVDLPAGDYKAYVYTGDLMDGCKGASEYHFYTDYVDASTTGTEIANIEKVTSGNASYLVSEAAFTLAEAKTVTMVASGHTNAVIFEQILPVTVESFDVTELSALVEKINGENLKETDYTISSWAVFKTAYDEAVAAVEKGASYAQQMATVQGNLENTYAGLVKRVATKEIVLDFGPEFEDEDTPGKVHATTMISGFLPEGVTLQHSAPDLGLGTMLYETNMDDNGIHYGFTSEVASGFTATGGNYFRDWVYGPGGSEYTFKADVPAGKYLVYVYTGCKEDVNTTRFYFGNGEAAAETTNGANASVDAEGRTVYTQTSSSGGQFAQPTCIYTVNVEPSKDVLSTVNGAALGTFSLTCFNDDESLAADEITARLNGIELVCIEETVVTPDEGDSETPDTEKPNTETPSTQTPSTQTPSTQTPSTQTPSTQTPSTQTPSTQTPNTETPGASAGTPIASGKNKFVVTTAGGVPSVEFTGSTATSVKIPATVVYDGVTYKVTSIGANAFKNNKKLTKVVIGANVTSIGANAFSGCTKLKTVTIGANVTSIGANAFKGCTALTKITIPAKVTTIGANAFNGCKKLTTVKIGAKVTKIGNSAFANCAALKTITIPNKVKTIGDKAFSGCKKLTSVTIGTSVTQIGKEAFKGCSKLNKITIKSTKLKKVGKNAFKGIKSTAKIKVPAKKLANYKKLLKGKGQSSKVKITK